VAQQKLRNDAGGDRNQNIVAAGLNPLVTTGRGIQVVAAPVFDHILPVAVLGRQALAPVKLMVRACATFVMSLMFVVTILLSAALSLFIATAIVVVPITLFMFAPFGW
jgi:hypothetical protein